MRRFFVFFRSVDTQNSSEMGEQIAENSLNVDVEEETSFEEVDYASLTKDQLINALNEQLKNFTLHSYSESKKIKEAFVEIYEGEKQVAFENFINNGGLESDFEYNDKVFESFENVFKSIRLKHHEQINELNKLKEDNFKKKSELLDKLRELISSEENENSIKQVKEIQDEWKKIGNVPNDKDKDLYKNYSALLTLYYDQRSIYNELKELDRKKNLEHKKELCEKAEKLALLPSINQALKGLNELHLEFKNTGPVPKENQEEIWQRFKQASDKIYELKKKYLENQQKIYEENLAKKEALLAEIEHYSNFETNSLEEWNKATEKLLAYRDTWKNAGFLSKEKSKDYNKRFWAIFKNFFNNKRAFFKILDKERNENLAKKLQLCELAEQLWASGEIDDKVLNEIKNLQRKWKEIGPVPIKKSNEVYFRFKKACDQFFDKKREDSKAEEAKQAQITKSKISFCDELEKNPSGVVEELLTKWTAFGNNNRKEDNQANDRFFKLISKLIDESAESSESKLKQKLIAEVEIYKGSSDAGTRLAKKEKAIKTKIQELENNISLWNNNLGFFSNSKSAKALTSEFDVKIKEAGEEIIKLKEQLKILKKL